MVNKQTISELDLGRIDGKADFSEARSRKSSFYDAFLVPKNVKLTDFDDGDTYFIQGFRGTGKTSLLRYYLQRNQPNKKFRKLILFKSSIDEDHRANISKEAGYEWVSTAPDKMEISQDFKTVWRWFVLHKIGELILENEEIVANATAANSFLNLIGLRDKIKIEKILGIIPKLEAANIRLRGNIGAVEAELSADFTSRKADEAVLPLRALVLKAQKLLKKISFNGRVVIAFDELEAFYTDATQYKRDLAMVRDLLFVVDSLNQDFLSEGSEIFLIAAVRSEVLYAMKASGQEIDRTVHDHGVTLSWHHENRSMRHPLLEMIRRKLLASGVKCDSDEDVLLQYFPRTVSGLDLDKYLLDGSFYKPRDIVWRLSIIQSDYPHEVFFRENLFQQTESSYSQKLWSEIEYELSASYPPDEISGIKRIFSGFRRYFDFRDIRTHIEEQISFNKPARRFLDESEAAALLHNLYRLGAIGNDFRVDSRGKARAIRWIFRNEPDLLINKQMVVNTAICKALSIRQRGEKSSLN